MSNKNFRTNVGKNILIFLVWKVNSRFLNQQKGLFAFKHYLSLFIVKSTFFHLLNYHVYLTFANASIPKLEKGYHDWQQSNSWKNSFQTIFALDTGEKNAE